MATQEAHAVYVRRVCTFLAYLRALYYIFSVDKMEILCAQSTQKMLRERKTQTFGENCCLY